MSLFYVVTLVVALFVVTRLIAQASVQVYRDLNPQAPVAPQDTPMPSYADLVAHHGIDPLS